MKLASAFAFALFLTSADAFGQSSPVQGTAFGVSSSSARQGDMSMRVNVSDRQRRQRFNNALKEYGANPSAENLKSQLLSAETGALIEKCNWKVQKGMIRKIKNQAQKVDVVVEPGFGLRLSQADREAAEQAASVGYQKAKLEAMTAAQATFDARQAAKKEKMAKKAA
eukprot:CAMPEP_0117007844 /NCGR_PEP_ID=MMETSP0472-20121206/7580_1 /TAXON_ID=693140 ORGANISM="Tiarina fusus, Strain LIS" /NCGR_SAMPLE_ID=MMETSP0472 /ASSEMBLY_ACC=CAM_ASM_000603 /LENGTH=167 /DNA_ID=CAMNT_0004709731 /DNA_START=104 /DNA_END=603 /DNA_ORIENTATION=+